MKDKKSIESRRKLLKSIAAGSGAIVAGKSLPDSWSKPIVDSVMLPAHAQTSLVCCEGVFCDINISGPIGGSAQVSSDCTIIMEGGSIAGDWSGSGTVAADRSFSFAVNFPSGTEQVTGFVYDDCATIVGNMTGWGGFGGAVTPGLTDISQCNS